MNFIHKYAPILLYQSPAENHLENLASLFHLIANTSDHCLYRLRNCSSCITDLLALFVAVVPTSQLLPIIDCLLANEADFRSNNGR
mmetsp:Transcript_9614/g.19909  ORF Transcript_9614/g.19909 Transcript_9614/m.19909 type:complete len:86 (+) Transcript_9614:1903-2160(+)